MGELLENGGMELFNGNIPVGWETDTPGLIRQETQQGQVHSGEAAVRMNNGADLRQTVPISGGCFYELSFFGHGEGAQVSVRATVTFLTGSAGEVGLIIFVRAMDLPNSNRDFGYFRGITMQAPQSATRAEIRFTVESNGQQYLDLDDVSFSVR
jgi:hypothetical protein